jgi:hypothetical protein
VKGAARFHLVDAAARLIGEKRAALVFLLDALRAFRPLPQNNFASGKALLLRTVFTEGEA